MKHYHKRYIWYLCTISIFWSVIFAISFFSGFFVGADEDVVLEAIYLLYLLGIYLLIQILSIVFIILKWRYTTYELTDDAIILKKGIFFKQKKTLPYHKIHAIDYKQNIIEKIFGIKKLSIDSGATMSADLAEIIIVEDNARVEELIEEIRLKIGIQDYLKKEEANENAYVYSLKFKFIDSLIKTSVVMVFAAIGIGILFLLSYYFSEEQSLDKILTFIVFILVIIVIAFIINFITKIIRYYNYKVIIKDKELIISYGLIQKVNNTLPLNRIKAIKIEEGLIHRIFKICSIKLEVVGFGSTNDKFVSNFYIPFCFKKDVINYINRLNLKFKYNEKSEKAPRRSFRYFYSLPILIFSLIYISFLPVVLMFENILFVYIGGYLLLMIIIFVAALLSYFNAGIYIDNNEVIIFNGAFNKKSTIILNENITEIEKVDTYCRAKKHVASFHIHFFNNAVKNVETVKFLDSKIFDNLVKIIRY